MSYCIYSTLKLSAPPTPFNMGGGVLKLSARAGGGEQVVQPLLAPCLQPHPATCVPCHSP